jgi:hypothetical protein
LHIVDLLSKTVVEVVELEETNMDHKSVPSMAIAGSKVTNIGESPDYDRTPEH